MTTTGDERMSDERAREILLEGSYMAAATSFADAREAERIGAAAIEEREELVEALVHEARGRFAFGEQTLEGPLADILVRHGRVIRDGSGYRWKTKGDGK